MKIEEDKTDKSLREGDISKNINCVSREIYKKPP